jgi:hypothetical protein
VYRVSDASKFAPYSVAAVFSFRGAPTALVYRDRFFVDPVAPAPEPRAFSVVKGKNELVPVDLPVLAAFPSAQSWDVESLSASSDGRILLRAVRADAVSYASAASLDGERTEVSAGAYRSALLPLSLKNAGGPLRLVIQAAAEDMPAKKAAVATAYGKGKPFPESYAISRSEDANTEAVLTSADSDVEKAWAYFDETRALLLLPDGTLYAVLSEASVSRKSLPPLPDGFSYTGVAMVGKTIAALWEEQDGWSVGSAGFLLVDAAS